MDEEYVYDEAKEEAAQKLANASFIFGIISLFSTLCCCPFVFSAIGIILALLSKGAQKFLSQKAKTGLALSIIGLVVSFVLTIFTVAMPFVLIKANPEYKKIFKEQYEESLDENEALLRELYGDDTFEQVQQIIDNL